MYELNLIKKLVLTSEKQRKGVKVLKLLTLLVHIAIICVLFLTWLKVSETERYNQEIDKIRQDIFAKRASINIREVEKEWEGYYYKLSVIAELTAKNTNFGLILREFGLYLPVADKICTININNSNTLMTEIAVRSLSKDSDIYQYEPIIRKAFEKSLFIGQNISVQGRSTVLIKKSSVEAIRLQMPVDTRKNNNE
jgi:hypothetical protein